VELRDSLDRVVLPVLEPADRPRLPVGRADDERGEQQQGDNRDAADLPVQLCLPFIWARLPG